MVNEIKEFVLKTVKEATASLSDTFGKISSKVSKLEDEQRLINEKINVLNSSEQHVKILYFKENDDAKLPERKKKGDAGYDAYANDTVEVLPHQSGKISCGLGLIIPEGFAIQNVNRGGNSLGKAYGSPIWVSDAYIDPNYRGICNFLVVNLGDKPITINKGDRVASLGLVKTYAMDFEHVDDYCERTGKDKEEIMNTERGESGFGASGNN
ncbi:hypothetical protein [uncultured Clostridium sp.]|uniref:hypothetical protein n=1 Tax=uncultured Clostridium sp. TaxID=59620 RepID=UPI0026305C84|nr:hypothetical protein [uncultured Clostridium sp.]